MFHLATEAHPLEAGCTGDIRRMVEPPTSLGSRGGRHASKLWVTVVAMYADWTRLLLLLDTLLELLLCLPFFACMKAVTTERTNPYPDLLGAVVLHAVNAKYSLNAVEETTFIIRLTTTGGLLSPSIVVPNDFRCKGNCCNEQDD